MKADGKKVSKETEAENKIRDDELNRTMGNVLDIFSKVTGMSRPEDMYVTGDVFKEDESYSESYSPNYNVSGFKWPKEFDLFKF